MSFLFHLVIYPAIYTSLKQHAVIFVLEAALAWVYAVAARSVASRWLARTFPVGSLASDQRSIHLNCNIVVGSVSVFILAGLVVELLPVFRAGRPTMPVWEQFRAMEILTLVVPMSIEGIHWLYRVVANCCAWRNTKSWSTVSEMDAPMSAISLGMIFGWLQPSCLGIAAASASFCLVSNRVRGWVCQYRRASVLACIGMIRCIFYAWIMCIPFVVVAGAWVMPTDRIIYAKWVPCYTLVSVIFIAFWVHLGKSVNRRYLAGSSAYVKEMGKHCESCCWRTSW